MTSNTDQVNRLLAEEDSSSDDDDDNLGGLARDTLMDKLFASSKESGLTGKSAPAPLQAKNWDKLLSSHTA